MDLPNIIVQKKNGDSVLLRQNLDGVLAAWKEDGCLLLKQSTDLAPINTILTNNPNSVDSVRNEIVLNDVWLIRYIQSQQLTDVSGS